MIPTLTTYLWQIQRHRDHYQRELDKRRALRLTAAIFFVLSLGIILYIVQ